MRPRAPLTLFALAVACTPSVASQSQATPAGAPPTSSSDAASPGPGPSPPPLLPVALRCPPRFDHGCSFFAHFPRDGGAPALFDVSHYRGGPVVVNERDVFVVSSATFAHVARYSKSALGTELPFDWSKGRVHEMALGDGHLVISTEEAVTDASPTAASYQVVAKTGDAYAVGTADGLVAWTTFGVAPGVWLLDRGERSPRRVSNRSASAIAADATGVWWWEPKDGGGRVRFSPRGGKTPVDVASEAQTPSQIAVDANDVWWIIEEKSGRGLRRVPKTGGAPIDVAHTKGPTGHRDGHSRLIVDDTFAWLNDFSAIVRVRKSTGVPEEVARIVDLDGDVISFDLDAREVWVSVQQYDPDPNPRRIPAL